MMVSNRNLLSSGLFLGAMLVSGRVSPIFASLDGTSLQAPWQSEMGNSTSQLHLEKCLQNPPPYQKEHRTAIVEHRTPIVTSSHT